MIQKQLHEHETPVEVSMNKFMRHEVQLSDDPVIDALTKTFINGMVKHNGNIDADVYVAESNDILNAEELAELRQLCSTAYNVYMVRQIPSIMDDIEKEFGQGGNLDSLLEKYQSG